MQTWAVLSLSYVRQDNSSPVVSAYPLSLLPVCLRAHMCVFTYCEIISYPTSQKKDAQNGANGCGQSGETIVERRGDEKVLLRALLCDGTCRSQFCFPKMQGLGAKPQQWASLSSSAIIFIHYCKWQESVVQCILHLMSSRYVSVVKKKS